MAKIKKVILEDNDNIHCIKFKLTFKPDSEYEDDSETYFPDESDVEYALEDSGLDQGNDYHVYKHKITNKKAVFIVEVTNEKTNKYMPTEEDIEHAMECSIDKWNIFYAETTFETINRAEYRDEKLTEMGL